MVFWFVYGKGKPGPTCFIRFWKSYLTKIAIVKRFKIDSTKMTIVKRFKLLAMNECLIEKRIC